MVEHPAVMQVDPGSGISSESEISFVGRAAASLGCLCAGSGDPVF
jgi:hypothetical protein